ncbi:MAG: family 20 glycosylhydrolase, partial [Acidothermus cellulolyticus]|nr:family 20 glycosylhydrolase [Acidothermus cellulolyticus]
YAWDPTMIAPDGDVLGVEAPLWSETIRTMADIEYLAWPRMAGIAEIGWTPQSERSWQEYRLRLAAQGPRWQELGVNFYPSPEVPWPTASTNAS